MSFYLDESVLRSYSDTRYFGKKEPETRKRLQAGEVLWSVMSGIELLPLIGNHLHNASGVLGGEEQVG